MTRSETEVNRLRHRVLTTLDRQPEPRLLGILSALDWARGQAPSAPLSGSTRPPASPLDLAHEEQRARQVNQHPRLSGVAPDYADAVQHTLLWLDGKAEAPPPTAEGKSTP